MLSRLKHFQNPFAWNQKVGRGMNVYHDIVDWLGGLPYETATADEVVTFMRQRGFVLERIEVKSDGGCNKYVLSHL
jgi:2-polyprenyl-6-hydroxyphenyl methylase/3-demethylubiquinone-9 3-methyltransferase